MELSQEIKQLLAKQRLSAADKVRIREICAAYNIFVPSCKCPNRLRDSLVQVYALLKNPTQLPPDAKFVWKGGNGVISQRYGRLSATTPDSVVKRIYLADNQLFQKYWKIQ